MKPGEKWSSRQTITYDLLWLPDKSQHFPLKPVPCVVLLHRTQLHSDNQLGFGGHVLEDVSLQPPQHVRPQEVMELLNLVLFGDVSELFQEAFEITEQTETRLVTTRLNIFSQCSEDENTSILLAGNISITDFLLVSAFSCVGA